MGYTFINFNVSQLNSLRSFWELDNTVSIEYVLEEGIKLNASLIHKLPKWLAVSNWNSICTKFVFMLRIKLIVFPCFSYDSRFNCGYTSRSMWWYNKSKNIIFILWLTVSYVFCFSFLMCFVVCEVFCLFNCFLEDRVSLCSPCLELCMYTILYLLVTDLLVVYCFLSALIKVMHHPVQTVKSNLPPRIGKISLFYSIKLSICVFQILKLFNK